MSAVQQDVRILKTPVVIIGSGIAGLLTALKLAEKGIANIVVSKTHLAENSSRMAQGGIAAVLPHNTEDSIQLHLDDTLKAGAGLCRTVAAKSILKEGASAIDDLIELGVAFDKESDNHLALGMEGAHSVRRIIHAGGDETGKTVQDTLIQRVMENPLITVLEQFFAHSLLVEDGECQGVCGIHTQFNKQFLPHHQWTALYAQHTVLATGGVGQLYSHTTNPRVSTGDGVALAYRAGAMVEDIEFVQFHPTGFWTPKGMAFLISEAVRGEGGILRNHMGKTFAQDQHPAGELAPRDVLTRLIHQEMQNTHQPHVFLDITHLPSETIETRFPSILKHCLTFGVDIRKQWIPVAPAAHYWMGGVKTNAFGQTSLGHLYAVGEVASTGLHGANRLASNSLLECLVLARRVARIIDKTNPKAPIKSSQTILDLGTTTPLPDLSTPCRPSQRMTLEQPLQLLKQLMWQTVGIVRNQKGLQMAQQQIAQWQNYAMQEGFFEVFPEGFEYKNMLLTAHCIVKAALERKESRGAHYREDYPKTLAKGIHLTLQNQPTTLVASNATISAP